MIAFDKIFDGIAKRRMPFDQDRLAFDDPHFDEPSAQRACTVDAGDHGPLPRAEKMQLCCFRHSFPLMNDEDFVGSDHFDDDEF
jgi:hypothetical protein